MTHISFLELKLTAVWHAPQSPQLHITCHSGLSSFFMDKESSWFYYVHVMHKGILEGGSR